MTSSTNAGRLWSFSSTCHGSFSIRWLGLVLYILVLCLANVTTNADTSSYAKHGLYWGDFPTYNAQLVNSSVWEEIPGVKLSFQLEKTTNVMVSYETILEGIRVGAPSPLPKEGNSDIVQIRCTINGIPFRPSSAFTSSYGVETRVYTKLANSFVIPLASNKTHEIRMQWKKNGKNVQRWFITNSGSHSAFNLIANADFQSIHYQHESQDIVLAATDVWKPMTSSMSFYLPSENYVTVGYSLVVQPQLLTFIKDRAVEYVSIRALIDGVAYTESAETFGTNAWNPMASSLRNSMRVKLRGGNHTVMLQWKKMGSAFKSWASNPSYLDGFTSSRNIIVTVDKFYSPVVMSHDRHTLVSSKVLSGGSSSVANGTWHVVNKNALEIHLIKESALLIRYALPVTQAENPNFDANMWKPLSEVEARVVVDGVAYTYRGGTSLTTGSRRFDSLFGSLPIVLEAGTHSISLQWRSDKVAWLSLNDIDGGFAHSESLLTYISSANAQPTITAPMNVATNEDQVLELYSIRVDDIDAELEEGMVMALNISVDHGTLSFPNSPLLANEITFEHSESSSKAVFLDHVANLNAALSGMQYHPPVHYFGQDMLHLTISDKGGIGNGPALTDSSDVEIEVIPVDNMFTFQLPESFSMEIISGKKNETNEVVVKGIVFEDIDSQNAFFQTEISATCGFIRIEYPVESEVLFQRGQLNRNSKSVVFYGKYSVVKNIFENGIIFVADETSCTSSIHKEILAISVINQENVLHSSVGFIVVDLTRETVVPSIVSPVYPRWSLEGIRINNDLEVNTGRTFQVTYLPVTSTDKTILNSEITSDLVLMSQEFASPMSQLVILDNGMMNYAFALKFGSNKATIMGSNYINAGSMSTIRLKLEGIDMMSPINCVIGESIVPAVKQPNISEIHCEVLIAVDDQSSSRSLAAKDSFPLRSAERVWMKVVQDSMETNYVSLNIIERFQILDVQPKNILPSAWTTINLVVNEDSVNYVAYCLFDGSWVVPSVHHLGNSICCEVPNELFSDLIRNNISVQVASADKRLLSAPITISLLSRPQLVSATLLVDESNGAIMLESQGNWNVDDLEYVSFSHCNFDGYQLDVSFQYHNSIFCVLNIGYQEATRCCGENSRSCLVSHQFDGFSTDSINVSCDASLYSPEVEDVLTANFITNGNIQYGSTFISFYTDTSKVGIVGSRCLVGEISLPAVITDINVVSCSLPTDLSVIKAVELVSSKGDLLSKATPEMMNLPQFVQAIPEHGSLSGGTFITLVSDKNISFNAEYECLFGGSSGLELVVAVPAALLNETTISCVSPPYVVGKTTIQVAVNKLLSNALWYEFDDAIHIESISPSYSALIGGSTVLVTGVGFEHLLNPPHCRFGKLSVQGLVINNTALSCVAPFFGAAEVVEFRIEVQGIVKYSKDFTFSFKDPYVLVSSSPKKIVVGSSHDFILRGFGFSQVSSNVQCLFNHTSSSTTGIVLNSTHVQCFLPENIDVGVAQISVRFDDYHLQDQSVSLEIVNLPTITTFSPNVGLRGTLMVYTIVGTFFPDGLQYHCAVGKHSGNIKIVDYETLSCSVFVPSKWESNETILSVNANGFPLQFIGADNLIYVLDSPTINRVHPLVGVVHGGEVVKIEGAGFWNLQNSHIRASLRCRFGSVLTPAILDATGDGVACISPSVERPARVSFGILLQDMPIDKTNFHFRYLHPMKIFSINRHMASIDGGDLVIVRGLSLVVDVPATCRFGNNSTAPARWLNDTALECVVPSVLAAGSVDFTVVFDNYSGDLPTFSFDFVLPPTVTSIHPLIGSSFGGTSLFIVGESFKFTDRYACSFNRDVVVQATFLDQNNLNCISPAGIVGNYSLSVQFADTGLPLKGYYATTQFIIVDFVRLTSIEPSSGPTNGSSVIRITVDDLTKVDNDSEIMCLFGETMVSSQLISVNELQCVSPPVSTSGAVDLALMSRGVVISFGTHHFTYTDDLLLTRFYPSIGTIDGSTSVKIYGFGFGQDDAFCRFGNLNKVPANILDSQTLVCKAPPSSSIGATNLSVEVGGQVATFDQSFQFVRSIFIQRIFPLQVFSQMKTIYIEGVGFEHANMIECLINDVRSQSQLFNDSLLGCEIPNTVIGTTTVSVLANGVQVEVNSSSPQVIEVVTAPSIYFVSPLSGPALTIAPIHIEGQGIVPRGVKTITCVLGSYSSIAKIDGYDISCDIQLPEHRGSFELLLDYEDMGVVSTGRSFLVNEPMQVLGMSPSKGVTGAVTHTVVHGFHFHSQYNWSCDVDGQSTVAIFLNSTAILCHLDNSLITVGAHKISLVANGNNYLLEDHFVVLDTGHVEYVYPIAGPVQGGFSLTVRGSGFFPSDNIACFFGDLQSQGKFLSASMIECEVPSSGAAHDVNLQLWIDNVQMATPGVITFSYYPSAQLTDIYPKVAVIGSETRATLSGQYFSSSIDYYCDIMGALVPATFITDTKMSCLLPSFNTTVDAQVSLVYKTNNNELKSSNVVELRYVNMMVMRGANARYLNVKGDDEISIFGQNFPYGANVTCNLQSQSFDGLVLDSNTVLCRFSGPLVKGAGAQVSLNFSGLLVDQFPVVVDVIEMPTLISVSMDKVSSIGGAKLIATGAGFLTQDVMYCRFGSKRVFATVLSNNKLSCSAPSLPTGVISFSLELAGSIAILQRIELQVLTPPFVRAVSPLILNDGGNVTIQLIGQGFNSSLPTYCAFQNFTTHVSPKSDSFGVCVFSTPFAVGMNQLFKVLVDEGAVIAYSSPIDVLSSWSHDVNHVVYPSFSPLQRNIKVHILLSDSLLSSKDAYSCRLNNRTVPAVMVDDKSLECVIYSGSTSGERMLSVASQATGSELLSTFTVLPDFAVKSVESAFVEESKEMEVVAIFDQPVELSHLSDLECVIGGSVFNAVQLTPFDVSCLVPMSSFCKSLDKILHIRTSDKVVDVTTTYQSVDDLCNSALSPSSTTSVGMGALTMYLFVNATRYYQVSKSIEKMFTHQARRNNGKLVAPPTFEVPSSNSDIPISLELQSSIDLSSKAFLAKSVRQRQCLLNSKIGCLESLDAESFSQGNMLTVSESEGMTSLSSDTMSRNGSSARLSLPLIESVYPAVVSNSNYTWVKISGRNFWHGSSCVLNNVTEITTAVISSSMIHCLVPPMTDRHADTIMLSVVNSEWEKSLGSVELWYEIAMKSNFRRWETAKTEVSTGTTPSSSVLSITGVLGLADLCLSEHGCSGRFSNIAVMGSSQHSMSWESHAFFSSSGNASRNLFSDKMLFNESIKFNSLSTNDTSDFATSSSDAAQNFEKIVGSKIFVVYPTSITFPCDDCFINFLGSDLHYGNPWCLQLNDLEETLSPCYLDEKGSKLFCELALSSSVQPRSYQLKLLSQCSETYFEAPFNVTLPSNKALSSLKAEVGPLGEKSVSTLSVFGQRPVIKEFHPSHGMVAGGTIVTVTVSNNARVKACYFGFENSFQTSPVLNLLSDSKFTCKVPSSSLSGKATFGIITDSKELLESVSSFEFKELPTFFGAVPAVERNSSVMIFGLGFSSFDRVYCRMMYSHEYNVVLSGRIYSDGQIECLGLPYTPKRRLLSVAVSFNSVEFLSAIPIESSKSKPLENTDMVAVGIKGAFQPEEDIYQGLSFNHTTHLNRINMKTLHWSCSKVNYVTFPLNGVQADTNYTCRINDQVISTPILTNANQTVCSVNPLKPGSYRLSLASENLLHAPIDMMIQCHPEPKIFGASLLPVDQDDKSVVDSLRLSLIAIEGLNFRNGMVIKCSLDDEIRMAVVDSSRSLLCSYQHLMPGSHEFYLLFEGKIMTRMTLCVTEEMIQLGGPLDDITSQNCQKLMTSEESTKLSKPSSSWKLIEHQIRSFTPRSGLTSGLTQVTIVADRINFRSDIYCLFDGHLRTEALVTDLDYVICRTPASLPGNHSLVLKSNDEVTTWCCGWFYFYPPGSLRSISPSTVDGSGGNVITLEISNMALDAELFCHLNDEVLNAVMVNSTHLSCRLPALYDSIAMVSYGSYAEKWSNELPIMVLRQNHVMEIHPWFGTKFGGTRIDIMLPTGLHNILSPKCKFGAAEPVDGVVAFRGIDDKTVVITCISPPVEFVGSVDVNIIDGNSVNAPVFFAGIYTYLYPAQVLSVDPFKFQREREIEILVSGEYFYDNDLLSCFVTGNNSVGEPFQYFVAAKWLSERMVMCTILPEMTVSIDHLTIAATNNRVDISSGSFLLTMTDISELMQAVPSRGFVNGGTNIHISFKKEITEQLYCSFEGIRSVAIITNPNVLMCTSPRQQRGLYNVSVVDLFGNHHGHFQFEYFDIPSIVVSDERSILRSSPSTVVFRGKLPIDGFGRLITPQPFSVIHENCIVDQVGELVVCKDVVYTGDDEFLYLDISVNGQDFISKVSVVPVFQPSVILWTDPLYALKDEGGYFTLRLTDMQVGSPTTCRFVVTKDDNKNILTSTAHQYAENVIRCPFPAFPLESEVYFSLWQYGNLIYGPSIVSIVESAVVDEVRPNQISLGMPATIMLSFKNPVSRFPAMALFYEHQRIPLTMINNSFALATVESIQSGDHDVVLLYESMNNFAKTVGKVTVVDYLHDFEINATVIARSRTNELTIRSKNCLLTNEFSCTIEQGICHVHSIDQCTASLSVFTDTSKLMLSLRLCAIKQCLDPVLVRPLDVVPGMTIIVAQPSVGPTLGGALIHLHGSGFVNDPTLECAFGELKSPAVVESSSLLQCTLPASTVVGPVEVNVLRKGVIVTRTVATFNYIPHLSNITVSPAAISALGGTPVYVRTFAEYDWRTRLHLCRFNEKYVEASVVDDHTLVCVAPSFDIPQVEFAISLEQSDVSVVRQLRVRSSLTAVFVEPTTVPPMTTSNITILFENMEDVMGSTLSGTDRISCVVDDEEVLHWIDDAMFVICQVEDLASGEHGLSIYFDEVLIFNQTITSRQPFFIDSVYPLSSFMSQSISIQVSSSQGSNQQETNEYTGCCFGDHRSPSMALSGTSWQCFSPTVNLGGFQNTVTLPVGLMKADGFCEYSGFTLSLFPSFEFVNQSVHLGSTFGNTAVVLKTRTQLQGVANIYCRFGTNIHAGQYVPGEGVLCITRPAPPGLYSIDISVNGVDFIPSGMHFEYVTPTTKDIEYSKSDQSSDEQPILLYTSESYFPSAGQLSFTAYGSNFNNESRCVLAEGALQPGSQIIYLETLFVSSKELNCVLPVHSPGKVALFVKNNAITSPSSVPIEFVAMPTLSAGIYTISPEFGPRNGYTTISVRLEKLSQYVEELYCIVGDEWVYSFNRTETSLQCTAPPSTMVGQVPVRLATRDGSLLEGLSFFEYIDDPMLFDVNPKRGTLNTELVVTGIGFAKFSSLSILLGEFEVPCAIITNTKMVCQIPSLPADQYPIVIQTNGQHVVQSGSIFEYFAPVVLSHLWPFNGPALKGGTLLSVYASNIPETIDIYCLIDATLVPGTVLSSELIQCRVPPHRPGLVHVSLIGNGVPLNAANNTLDFLYAPDISVDKITPEFGYTSGEFPVFVFGSNFINTSSLGCKFADMRSRAIYLSNNSLVCLSPSPIGRPELKDLKNVPVEVTVNGYDFSESKVMFSYSEPCDQGFFCPGMSRQLCPNGTYCPVNSRNFTLCPPGYFQPKEGQTGCVICPVGYICPDLGMSRPVICPPGLICDTMGLRASTKLCPAGRYCLNGTKASSLREFEGNPSWVTDYVTGVAFFNESTYDWKYRTWPAPAVGKSRPLHPPEASCDGLVCSGGSSNVLAEAPFPCPIGHFCRAGAGTQIPMPKNFSSPQRCYDGFFCPRGSVSPEGSGPCPNGYFCPTQIDAIICPAGHYCPGVGNRDPIECYPGTYNPFEGQANCTVCPTGHICPGWGLLLPEPCPAGFVCLSLGLSYPVVLCPQGYRCNEGTLTLDPSDTTTLKPVVCKEGEFCLGGVSQRSTVDWIPSQPYGVTHPQLCSEGTYCQAGAYLSSGSGLCFKGHYCPPNSSFPTETPVGNFASGLGSVAPTLCYPGTYAPLNAQVNCLPCPSGHSCISYGTYIPTICLEGTYRSQVDSVTCATCPTGTYSYEVGSPDLSLCLPCPKGRICGIKKMTTLKASKDCPAGYICGYGTDRSSQFTHLTPAGFHTPPNTSPEDQYKLFCQPGYYCPRGTATYMQYGGKCPVGSFCPLATPAAVTADTKCPMFTASLGGSDQLQDCRISDINVCDKAMIDEDKPMEDLTYYNTFEYTTLDDSLTKISFDSSTSATVPTGEVQVVAKIYPTNISSSSPLWVNDTIEAFRTCPLYGSGDGNDRIIVIGRNFRDTKLNYCRFRACFSANNGIHPRRCKNQIRKPTGEVMDKIGNVSDATYVTRARYLSPTRMECDTPEFLFDRDFNPTLEDHNYQCRYISAFGKIESDSSSGNFSYVRPCDRSAASCMNLPYVGYEFFISLTFPCTVTETLADMCSHLPEPGYMFNPCMSAEVLVEVTNDGVHYTTGDDLNGVSLISTVRYWDHNTMYNPFKNYTINATAAVFTYVYPEYFYQNTGIMSMETQYCRLPRYSEEGEREREKGWFSLQANHAAHVHIDFSHLPADLVYDEHYRIAIFMQPSRCTVELCDMSRVRLSPEEFLPCRKPKELPYWFQQADIPKNVRNNFTVYALDDLLFKVEIHLLYGLYTAYAPLFDNTTTVRIAGPGRSKSFEGRKLADITTRNLTKYISFEEHKVRMEYIFCAVVYQSDNTFVSQPLNLPPLYSKYERGRALIMYNVTKDQDQVRLYLDDRSLVRYGVEFWLMPATTPDESKELLDAYFETFQQTTYDSTNGYQFDFQSLVIPYLPYFSNCYTFDSYIPIWLLLEGKECALPDFYPKSWNRYKFPALPDQDDMRFVGPFDFFEEPVADWCERDLYCNYEEELGGQDNTPRWFETESGTGLFVIIRTPLNYFEYTGRGGTHISRYDAGGGQVADDLLAISGDNFIAVSVDHSLGDVISGCVYNCFARSYTLTIAYYQEDFFNKRIVSASLAGDQYDFNQDDTSYTLHISYYPLGFLDLILNFAFDLSIFIVIFIFVGFLTIFIGFISWAFTRVSTLLQNPPALRIFSMLALTVPPPLAGVTLGVIPIWFMTSMGNYYINGFFYTDPNAPVHADIGTLYLDGYPLEYGALGAAITTTQMEQARSGRVGAMFFIIAFFCFYASSKMYFPRDESKRELEIAKKRTKLAEKEDLWKPMLWRKANFMFSSFVLATILVCIVELSYWTLYGDFFYQIFVMLTIFAELVNYACDAQLNDTMLVAPLNCGFTFVQGLVGFGAPDFLSFLLSNFVDFAITNFARVYQDFYLGFIFGAFDLVFNTGKQIAHKILPKYLSGATTEEEEKAKKAAEEAEQDFRKRSVEGVVTEDDESESVEPILEYLADIASDTFVVFYFPFFVYLLMQYRNEIQIPVVYGIRQSDMMIYLVFQLFLIAFQPFIDILNHSQNELFHGWKIYEYLVYSRYRFLQRETRWKGMEITLDECIEEKLRRLDQMCFSSQYFLMLTVHVNGIIYLVLAYETWLFWGYSPFSDSGFFLLFGFLTAVFIAFEWVVMWFAIRLKVWKIKHESTAWHLQQKEEDELDVPAWEEIKGASTEAFLMNQRITSETFRYKFLNYNRTWLINQLPQILTPRTMRRSRPYLINQFARIINARRDDISDDSDDDKDKKFGPVALTAPSRNIIRFWLGRARRRLRLRNIVEPLIKRARGAQCEQCLSRKQLQIEYEVDVDTMANMYDNAYPDDEEVDQVQWKQFWINNQRYHTICLACLTKRKELDARNQIQGGAIDPSLFEDPEQEAYPDWGPVFLSAPSKAILLNWYNKAKKLRAGKRRTPGRTRKDKVVKDISDDEGEDPMFSWLKEGLKDITPASKAIAVKWMRTARARLQQKRGKGTGIRESELQQLENAEALNETFRSGKKSKTVKK